MMRVKVQSRPRIYTFQWQARRRALLGGPTYLSYAAAQNTWTIFYERSIKFRGTHYIINLY